MLQILDRETLGLIWSGNITKWSDQRIKATNPVEVANKLPDDNITIGYNDNDVLTIVEVVKRALESFSEDFRTALAAANRTFSLMSPTLCGHALDAGASTALRLSWLNVPPFYVIDFAILFIIQKYKIINNTKQSNWQKTANGLTFLNYPDAYDSGLPWINMINKAGSTVSPSTTSVQSAMADFTSEYSQKNFSIDIVDANGTASWPISYLTFFTVGRNITSFDCTNAQEMLEFIAWVHTNDEYSRLLLILFYIINN
jgi:ABC-type phosphate transport system substrate-binding protein